MIRLLSIRLLHAVLVALLVGALTFLSIILQRGANSAPDQSLTSLFLGWMGDLLTFDLGKSLVSGESVVDKVAQGLSSSIPLALGGLILSLLIGPPLGVIAGLRRGGFVDRALLFLSTATRAIPQFVLGIILILIFAVAMAALPSNGSGTFAHAILPTASLALGLAAVSSVVARDATLAITSSPRYASERLEQHSAFAVLKQHGLRNIQGPLVASLGVQLVYLIEGVIVVETLFSWPGIGQGLVHAIVQRDVLMVQGTALAIGLMFVILKTVVDLANHSIDSRRRNS
ncbi:ABC transporter permease [Pseudomonas cichorii]|uniref:ABC transporter permease n=1 Tax=Pseudomonas cichorii TaxID=36746 RepID=UPI0019109CBF|nr:ABC transporter permease [Pseudomonas cichorii]GFM81334.1 ABC transporter permease [Pseudomonas cichorii]